MAENVKKYGAAYVLESGGKLRIALHSEGSQEITLAEATEVSTQVFQTLANPLGDFTLNMEDAPDDESR